MNREQLSMDETSIFIVIPCAQKMAVKFLMKQAGNGRDVDILDWTLCFKITLFIFSSLGSFLLRFHNTFLVWGVFLCMMFQIPFPMTHCITNGWHLRPTWHFHIYTNEEIYMTQQHTILTFSNSNKTRAAIGIFFCTNYQNKTFIHIKKSALIFSDLHTFQIHRTQFSNLSSHRPHPHQTTGATSNDT